MLRLRRNLINIIRTKTKPSFYLSFAAAYRVRKRFGSPIRVQRKLVPNPSQLTVTQHLINMATATRPLRFNFFYLLNVLLFASVDRAELEVLDEYSLTNITASVKKGCVLVALQPTCDTELTSILHKLSHAFKNESRASIGVLKQSDVSSISWESSRGRDMVDEGDLVFFPRKLIERTCLIQPRQKPPKAERYYGSKTLQELLAFINTKCDTFRQLDGSLSSAGLARKRILDNLFRVPNSDGPSLASYSGPVNIGSTCERIPLPSKEKFFHEYFFRSKPVVITGKKKQQLNCRIPCHLS